MLQETEKLLDKLSEKFAGGRKEVIVGGKKRKPLNHRRFIESLAEGATLAVAVKDSGSLAKSTLSRQVVGSKILEAHPEFREAITVKSPSFQPYLTLYSRPWESLYTLRSWIAFDAESLEA